MHLRVRDIAVLLNVSEKTIYRMIKSETIPCFRVGGQWRFDRREIKSWFEDMRGLPAKDRPADNDEAISLSGLIQKGGIFQGVAGLNKRDAISACVALIGGRMPDMDAASLEASILEREAICSTAIGHGVALPHPRSSGELAGAPAMALCRLSRPIPFDALDNEDIETLFFIFTDNERHFLRIQAKLMRLLRDVETLSVVKAGTSPERILNVISKRENEIFGGGN